MKQLPILFGAINYEFRMQFRRLALWITFLCIACLFLIRGGFHTFVVFEPNEPLLILIAEWARSLNSLLPIVAGVLLADRLARDRKTRVDELFTSTPGALSIRLTGKYVGSTLATLLPIFLFYSIGVGSILYQTHNVMTIPYALEAFATISLPGILFVSAFSIACPFLLWVPLYQFLFVGYWFWGNILTPRNGIPTLSPTILTPVGGYMASAFFGDNQQLIENATVLQGVESLSLLLGISLLVMVVLWRLMKWEQVRQ
jgi:ABC-2 type transport system permease protein